MDAILLRAMWEACMFYGGSFLEVRGGSDENFDHSEKLPGRLS